MLLTLVGSSGTALYVMALLSRKCKNVIFRVEPFQNLTGAACCPCYLDEFPSLLVYNFFRVGLSFTVGNHFCTCYKLEC